MPTKLNVHWTISLEHEVNFRRLNSIRMVSQWSYDRQESSNCLSLRLHRRSESGRKYPILVGHRDLCFQNKCCKSIKEGAASSEVSREHNNVYRRAVRSGHALE